MGCYCSTEAEEKSSLVSSSKSFQAKKAVFEQPNQKVATKPTQAKKPTTKPTAKTTQAAPVANNTTKATAYQKPAPKATVPAYQKPAPRATVSAYQKPSTTKTQVNNAHKSTFTKVTENVAPKPNFKVPQSKTGALLQWCQENTKEYKEVEIRNFTSSWQSGVAFMALLHHFRPDLINMKQATSDNIKNLDRAFKAAQKAGIAQLLEADEIAEYPEKLSIITYLTLWYQQFGPK